MKELVKKAYSFAKIAENALEIAEDQNEHPIRRYRAANIAKRFFNHAQRLLDSQPCLWYNSSTNPDGKFDMPMQCKAKGCKGYFYPEEDRPDCFISYKELIE